MRGGVGVPRSGWGSRDHPPMTRSRVLHAAPRPLPPAQGVLPGAASGSAGGRGSSPLGRGLGEQGLWVWGGQQKRIGPRPGRRCPGWSSRACCAAREKPGQPRSISAWLGEDAERLRRCWRDAQREGSGRETGGQGSLAEPGRGRPPGAPLPQQAAGRGRPACLGCHTLPAPAPTADPDPRPAAESQGARPPGLRSNPSPPLGFQELGLLPRLPSDPISAPKGSPRSSQAFASPRTPQLHPLAHAPFSRQPAQISPGPLGLRASPRRLCLLSWVTRVRVCVYPSVGQCPPKPGQSGVLPCCLGVLGGSFEPV